MSYSYIVSRRKILFANNHIYHVFNRGVHKSTIFQHDSDYRYWEMLLYWCANYDYPYSTYLNRLQEFKQTRNSKDNFIQLFDQKYKYPHPLVEILAYVEMPNHYHLVLEQVSDDGISRFMQKLSTAFTMYINAKYDFSGSLFQGKFQAVFVDTDEQLIQVLRYVLRNPINAGLVTKKNPFYQWSSLPEYLGLKDTAIIVDTHLPDDFKLKDKLLLIIDTELTQAELSTLSGLTLDKI